MCILDRMVFPLNTCSDGYVFGPFSDSILLVVMFDCGLIEWRSIPAGYNDKGEHVRPDKATPEHLPGVNDGHERSACVYSAEDPNAGCITPDN